MVLVVSCSGLACFEYGLHRGFALRIPGAVPRRALEALCNACLIGPKPKTLNPKP